MKIRKDKMLGWIIDRCLRHPLRRTTMFGGHLRYKGKTVIVGICSICRKALAKDTVMG